ncbi:MAG: tRNA (adenosine(37)-N6)-dimethylallyltransferase MiaA, partial [Eubacteriales bacterium]
AAARYAADDILRRGKTPVFCGGTGLYLDSAIAGDRFAEIKCDAALREKLSARTPAENHLELQKIDPISAAAIHPNNTKRVIRALEIYIATGIPKSEWDERSRSIPPYYHAHIVGLDYRLRRTLYDRIDRRVDLMLEAGLEDEVRSLAEDGAFGDIERSTAACAIGYKELLDYFAGRCTRAEAVELIKQLSRNYAKRQRTWFYKNPDIKWIYNDDFDLEEAEQRQKYVNIILTMLNC